MEKENLNKNLKEIFEASYVIPLYQRNFEWREPQISRLLQDTFQAYMANPNGNYFIGSLIVKRRNDDSFEVIDGQQRLTVLSLIGSFIGLTTHNRLFYDSRPEVSKFLTLLYGKGDVKSLSHPSTKYLNEGITSIEDVNLTEWTDLEKNTPFIKDGVVCDEGFARYLKENVILLRVEVPDDTDVASYFEIMNNRGEQLQEHEIIKALLAAEIKRPDGTADIAKQKEFAMIWDACSQMDNHVQRLFNVDTRRKYFGDNYEGYFFNGLTSDDAMAENQNLTIEQILSGEGDDCRIIDNQYKLDDSNEGQQYNSIIDFPNFLMHILRAFYNEEYKIKEGQDKNIPLDGGKLLTVFNKIKDKIEPEEFIKHLFRSRTFFDRFIVKTIPDPNDEDELKWVLGRPYKSNDSLKFKTTFDDFFQQKCIKVCSMLQVSFRNRKNKSWLLSAIEWFDKEGNIFIDPAAFITELDKFATERIASQGFLHLNVLKDDESMNRENSYTEGTDTPHFLFNYIDYLYWVEWKTGRKHDIRLTEKLKDFSFKYWNSVEHHLAQNKANKIAGYENFVDNLGNLCLISKSANSRLNDRLVEEKVKFFSDKNLGAKRQIMYSQFEWTAEDIKRHYNDIVKLLSCAYDILGLPGPNQN